MIKSEIIGMLGGGDVEIVTVNKTLNRSYASDTVEGVHNFTVGRRSMVSAIISHDSGNNFGDKNGQAMIGIEGAETAVYSSNWGKTSQRKSSPLSISTILNPGHYAVVVGISLITRVESFKAQTLTMCITPI